MLLFIILCIKYLHTHLHIHVLLLLLFKCKIKKKKTKMQFRLDVVAVHIVQNNSLEQRVSNLKMTVL